MISCKNRIQYFGEHSKGLGNQADVELDMINGISAADSRSLMQPNDTKYGKLLDKADFSNTETCLFTRLNDAFRKTFDPGGQNKIWKINGPRKPTSDERAASLNFIRLLRVVITPSVTSESTGR